MKTSKRLFIVLIVMAIAVCCFGANKPTAREKTDTEIVVQGNNRFALELYAKLRGGQGNLFFSPYSISTALAMTYAGAHGRTAIQMATVLHFPACVAEATPSRRRPVAVKQDARSLSEPTSERKQLHPAFGKIIKDLNARGAKGSYELTVANALWGQKGYGFLKEFLGLIKINYEGELREVDFAQATEAARQTINTWVENQTNNKIKDLIQQGVLNRLTRLVLTNAIYFKGNWARQFEEDKTAQGPFTLLNADMIDVAMMNQTAEFGYMEAEDFQGLELPYVDDELSMIILLPKQTDGLADLEKALTAERLSQWLARLHRCEVIVSVPKFKMTSQFMLADVLKSMGMTDAFSTRADFSGINGKRDLFISAVIHKAYIDVNEEGTEAAAATGVVVGLTSVGPSRIPVFRADHPYVFLIRDNHSGSILFIGRVTNPKAQSKI